MSWGRGRLKDKARIPHKPQRHSKPGRQGWAGSRRQAPGRPADLRPGQPSPKAMAPLCIYFVFTKHFYIF